MMKKILVAVFMLTLMVSIGCASDSNSNSINSKDSKNSSNITWVENLEDGIVIAKKENKNILINFTGSDWCIWCKRLNGEVFTQKQFADYAKKNLVLVRLDFPRNTPQSEVTKQYNNNLARKYGIQGFPTIILLDKNGNFVYQTGYQEGGADNYVKHLSQIFSKI